jgi:hypothetical protein
MIIYTGYFNSTFNLCFPTFRTLKKGMIRYQNIIKSADVLTILLLWSLLNNLRFESRFHGRHNRERNYWESVESWSFSNAKYKQETADFDKLIRLHSNYMLFYGHVLPIHYGKKYSTNPELLLHMRTSQKYIFRSVQYKWWISIVINVFMTNSIVAVTVFDGGSIWR